MTPTYAACVDFLLQAARLLGVSYRDANALLFFVVWPAVTAVLVLLVLRGARRGRHPVATSFARRPTESDEDQQIGPSARS
jgi:hypothetical protein